jgi:hypothetical protein
MKVVYIVFDNYGGGHYSKPVAVYASKYAAIRHAHEKGLVWDEMEGGE